MVTPSTHRSHSSTVWHGSTSCTARYNELNQCSIYYAIAGTISALLSDYDGKLVWVNAPWDDRKVWRSVPLTASSGQSMPLLGRMMKVYSSPTSSHHLPSTVVLICPATTTGFALFDVMSYNILYRIAQDSLGVRHTNLGL